MMVRILIQNASLLITLSFFYSVIRWYRPRNEKLLWVICGIWFGLVAVAVMMTPYEYSPGVFYDGRSVILTLAGFWGGAYSAFMTAIIAGIYRIYLGGDGLWAGLATIIFSGATGLFFRRVFKDQLKELKLFSLTLIGFVAHVGMLVSQLLLPDNPFSTLKAIWFPIMVVLPAAFVAVARLFQLTDNYLDKTAQTKEAEELYRTTLMSIGDAVICTDKNGHITQMNKVAEELTEWNFAAARGKQLKEVFRIINEENRQEVESPFSKVIKSGKTVGLANHTLLISRTGREIPIADSGAPILKSSEILGVVLVFRDQTEEKMHQKKLEESECRYRQKEFWLRESQRVGNIGSYDLDIRGDRWSASEVLDDILGISGDAPHNLQGWLALVHPEQRTEVLDYFQDIVLKEKKNFQKEYKIIRENDGAERWVLGHGELTLDQAGDPIRMLGTIQDITKRKNFEQQLLESEERFRKAILGSPFPTMVHDESGKILSLSEGWTFFSGYQAADLPTLKEWTEKAYGGKAREIEDYVSGIFDEDKTVFSGEYEIKTKSGERRIWSFYTTPLGLDGQGKIMLSTASDITERVKAERQLAESERAYRLLFERHTAVKLLTDPETGQIIKANEAAADFYGWTIRQLESMKITDINTHPLEDIKKAMKRALSKRRTYFEFEHRLANGEVRDVEVFSSPTEYNGKILLHGIIHDITEKKRLFHELIHAKEKAEESDKLKTAFLANMSHEIRTPLNGIVGFANLLVEEPDLSERDKQEFRKIINKNNDVLLKIINDILDVSSLESGRSLVAKHLFSVDETLSYLYLVYKKRLQDEGKKAVALKLKSVAPTILLDTDEKRFIQIFSNLLDNAIRFTNNGTICFGVSSTENGRMEFFISDTGIGVPIEKQQVIFESFTQADVSLTRSYGGTGLGLSIVKKLVELLGGQIFLQSEPEKGSSFSFWLPYIEDTIQHDSASD